VSGRRLATSTTEAAPFFEARHVALAERLGSGALDALAGEHDAAVVARSLGAPLGLYRHLLPEALGGAPAGQPADATTIDVRALCVVREALAQVSPLADAIFAVQGLGSYPIVLAGTEAQRARWLPGVATGERIAAFGLTEPEAGSDVASLRATARRDSDGWILDGDKTLISNATIADHVVVFANADPAAGRRGITAFVVERATPGLSVEPIAMSIPHPIGAIALRSCRVAGDALLGAVGQGFSLAMRTLDAFRISVGAAANGMAARALGAAIAHVRARSQFGKPLAERELVRAHLADMATELDAARLLVARAAHRRDTSPDRVTTEAAMAKMYATEAAQRVIDLAVQLHGGRGVVDGSVVEALYREIRPLRIYEGATDVQKLVIAKGLLDRAAEGA
jgi:acyl-CoA dehydrogenase